VYRRVLEVVRGERDRASARELIITENRHYARRQLIWFRKEPNLVWIQRAGEHEDTQSPLGSRTFVKIGLTLPASELAARIEQRVARQFARGLVQEIRALLARGVPATARPFGALGYRQGLELIQGVRDEAATRDLIVRDTRRYARRQLIWFRKEPNLVWIPHSGDDPVAIDDAPRVVIERLGRSPIIHAETESPTHGADV
jgi:tRNA A37 N6-isopentenylltransferase MiaA